MLLHVWPCSPSSSPEVVLLRRLMNLLRRHRLYHRHYRQQQQQRHPRSHYYQQMMLLRSSRSIRRAPPRSAPLPSQVHKPLPQTPIFIFSTLPQPPFNLQQPPPPQRRHPRPYSPSPRPYRRRLPAPHHTPPATPSPPPHAPRCSACRPSAYASALPPPPPLSSPRRCPCSRCGSTCPATRACACNPPSSTAKLSHYRQVRAGLRPRHRVQPHPVLTRHERRVRRGWSRDRAQARCDTRYAEAVPSGRQHQHGTRR